jgi:hypothetical protein
MQSLTMCNTYRCKYCSKCFTHAPALVQHERAHVQQMHSPDPQSRIYSSAEGRSLLDHPPPPAPTGWLREVKPRKDSTRKDVIYSRREGSGSDRPALYLRSLSEATRWLQTNPDCGLTLDDFDFVVRKSDKAEKSFSNDDHPQEERRTSLDIPSSQSDEPRTAGGEGDGGPTLGVATRASSCNAMSGGKGSGRSTPSEYSRQPVCSRLKQCSDPNTSVPAAQASPSHQKPKKMWAMAAAAGVGEDGLTGGKDKDKEPSAIDPAAAAAATDTASGGVGVNTQADGTERQKRERKRTAFYDPQAGHQDATTPTAAAVGTTISNFRC